MAPRVMVRPARSTAAACVGANVSGGTANGSPKYLLHFLGNYVYPDPKGPEPDPKREPVADPKTGPELDPMKSFLKHAKNASKSTDLPPEAASSSTSCN